jgi:hypothetical protein
MKLIMETWRKLLSEEKLRVFDFDDTLAQTDSMIVLHRADGTTVEQSPGEWAVYTPQGGDEFDFSQFSGELINPREVKAYTNVLRNVLGAGAEGRKTVILTARAPAAQEGITKFLEDIGIDPTALELVTLGSSNPQDKANWIEQMVQEGYDDILFFDDSSKNVDAVAALKDKYPNIKLVARLV